MNMLESDRQPERVYRADADVWLSVAFQHVKDQMSGAFRASFDPLAFGAEEEAYRRSQFQTVSSGSTKSATCLDGASVVAIKRSGSVLSIAKIINSQNELESLLLALNNH